MAVNVTEAAIREIAAIVRQQNLDPETIRLRVGVKGGGCSGFSYLLDLTESQKDTDQVWEYTARVPVPKAAAAAVGAAAGSGAERRRVCGIEGHRRHIRMHGRGRCSGTAAASSRIGERGPHASAGRAGGGWRRPRRTTGRAATPHAPPRLPGLKPRTPGSGSYFP